MGRKIDNVNQRDADVLELVHALMHEYRALQYRILRDGPHDITHMDSKVLHFFERHPGATQSDLAAHSGRDKAQLARLVKGLVEGGLLDRESDPVDGRVVRLTLSKAGRKVQGSLGDEAASLKAQAVRGLTASERETLADLLSRVRANLAGDA